MENRNPKLSTKGRPFLATMVFAGAALAAPAIAGAACRARGGCAVPAPIVHAGALAGHAAGRFDLGPTSFAAACNGTIAGSCGDDSGRVPPVRFWALDGFKDANSGCLDPVATQALVSLEGDLGQAGPGGWVLAGADWAGGRLGGPAAVDGCFRDARRGGAEARTVVELSFADAASGEGTPEHDAWYVIAAVPEQDGGFDLDRIRGGDTGIPAGASPAHLVVRSVPDLRVIGQDGGAAERPVAEAPVEGTSNAASEAYFDVEVFIESPRPDYFTELGRNAGPQLIAGVQVVYMTSPEPPTSSLGNWQPARDVADPVNHVAPVVPWGKSTAWVSLPAAPGQQYWLAARLVYRDATVNAQLGAGPESSAPQLVSPTGGSCGPVVAPFAAERRFDQLAADYVHDGAAVRWTTLAEPATTAFQVLRSSARDGSWSEVGAPVAARGAGSYYEVLDAGVTDDSGATWFYRIQELTGGGPGSRSSVFRLSGPHPSLPVADAQATATTFGPRIRTAR